MKFKTELMVALTFLAVACGHRGSKEVTTKTEEEIVLNGNFQENAKELETKGMKPETDQDGTIKLVWDEEKLFATFTKMLMAKVGTEEGSTVLPSESDAARIAETFKKDPMKFLVFKHAFDLAHTSETGPKLSFDEAFRYAEKTADEAAKDAKSQLEIKEKGYAMLKSDAANIALVISEKMDPAIEEFAAAATKTVNEVTPEEKALLRAKFDNDIRKEFSKESRE